LKKLENIYIPSQ